MMLQLKTASTLQSQSTTKQTRSGFIAAGNSIPMKPFNKAVKQVHRMAAKFVL